METIPYLIYEDRARYDQWLKPLIAFTIATTMIPALVLFSSEPVGAWILLATTVFDALLFHAIMPRRYQIYSDRLRIVLGWPFAINLSLTTIKEVRAASGSEAYIYWGVRFATSRLTVVEIARNRGLNFVISPSDREAFLQQLNQTLGIASRPNS